MLKLGRKQAEPVTCTWALTLHPPVAGDAAWRARLLKGVRGELERRLPRAPQSREFKWGNAVFQVQARLASGTWKPGAEIRLSLTQPFLGNGANGGKGGGGDYASLALPDERLQRLGERLIGLDHVADEALLRLRCRWDGQLDDWSERTGTPLSPAVRSLLEERVPLFVFAGDPGVGKSAVAQVIADRYCRSAGTEGTLIWLDTGTRGNGLVGDFSSRLRAAFQAASGLAERQPVFVLVDEADALMMRRSEEQAHQEDRAATATILQVLDTMPASARLAVFVTTNLVETVDAAVRRRGTVYEFGRPNRSARRILLERWLPGAGWRFHQRAAGASAGMTPADMEQAVAQATLAAMRAGQELSPNLVLVHLRRGQRTGRV